MQLEYKSQAIKQLKRLPLREKKKVVRKLEFLVKDPWLGKPLKGELEGFYSLRAWPYRIIYKISNRAIIIFSVTHRRAAYG